MGIETSRLLFRPYEDSDLEFLVSLVADKEMVRFIGNGQTKNREEAVSFFNRIQASYRVGQDLGLQVLVRKDDGIRIGHAGLVSQRIDGVEEIEIGYWIARDYWKNGYATEAALGLRDHGTKQLAIKRFISLIQPGNIASRQVAIKIGMTLWKQVVFSGHDVLVYAFQ